MIYFEFLNKNDAEKVLSRIFEILYSNMSVIAPTGNSHDEDYRLWHNAVAPALEKDQRQIILIYDDTEIIGYFQYYVNSTTFMMEEIQFNKEYHGTGLFRCLYSYLFEIIPRETLYVEAYAHKKNQKSQGVLKHLGLDIIGENKNGNCYHFRGDCREVLGKYNTHNIPVKTIEIHGANEHNTISKTRVGCRGVVVKGSYMLISHEVNTDYYLIPGGGLEDGETLEECCIREVREETGYIVKPVRHFLTINEYYEDCKYIGHYFICDVTGEGEQSLTDTERDRGLIPEWIDINTMLEKYSRHDDFAEVNEDKRGSYLREYTALREYFEQIYEN